MPCSLLQISHGEEKVVWYGERLDIHMEGHQQWNIFLPLHPPDNTELWQHKADELNI